MGSVEPYQTAKGRRWRVRYRKPDGKTTGKRGFLTKNAALGFLIDVEGDKRQGTYVDPSRGKILMRDWATTWLDAKANLKPSTRQRYSDIITAHITPAWGNHQLAEITHVEVQQWIAGQKGSAATIVKHHRVLSQILKLAVKDKRIAVNPAEGVDLPTVKAKKRRYLTAKQVEALADASGEYRPLILLLAYTGLRWGEMAALRVRDVDMLRRRVTVTEAVAIVKGKIVWSDPKDHEHRWIPIPKSVCAELAPMMNGKSRDDLLFPGPRSGDVLRHQAARRSWFDDAVVQAKCPEGLTPHELRHTAASLAISAGANVKALQRMLGHAKASMTLDVYSDLFDDDLESVAVALDESRTAARIG